jgi:hypothetical protein
MNSKDEFLFAVSGIKAIFAGVFAAAYIAGLASDDPGAMDKDRHKEIKDNAFALAESFMAESIEQFSKLEE